MVILPASRLALLETKVVQRTFLVHYRVAKLEMKVVLRIVLVLSRLAQLVIKVGTYVFEPTIGYFEFIQNPVSFSPSFLLILSLHPTSVMLWMPVMPIPSKHQMAKS